MTDLAARRNEAEARLEELRASRGAAVLGNKKFDPAEIISLEGELGALDDAEGVRAKQARAEAQLEFTKRLAQKRDELAALEAKRLGAIQDANMAARSLAESIGHVLEANAEMAAVAHDISGGPVPIPLQATDLVSRLAGRLSAVMSSIAGHRNRFGFLQWRGSLYTAADDWKACEAKITKPHLQPLLKKETDK